MAMLVLFFDLTGVVAVSTFGALFYYSFTNAAALKLKNEKRLYKKMVPLVGLVTCIILLAFVLFASTEAWIIGGISLASGTIYYGLKKYALKQTANK